MHLKNFFVCALIQEKNAHVARVILGNLRTTTTSGSELQCTAQARLVNFVVVVSSPTSNKTDLKFRWTATSFSWGDGRRLFLTLLTVWEWVNWKRSQRLWCTFIIMMVSYQMRNSFPCTMKSSWVFCCSKVNVRLSIEPICDLRIAKFSDAPQSLWLVINHAYTHSSGLETVGPTFKNLYSKLNIVISSPLHLH